MAPDFGKLVLNNYSKKSGIFPGVFDHWLHRAKSTCRICHIGIGFAMKAEDTDFRSADTINGYCCGACHNGKKSLGGQEIFAACAVKFTDETGKRRIRCNSQGKAGKRQYDYRTFTKNLPRLKGDLIGWEKAEAEEKVQPIDFIEDISY